LQYGQAVALQPSFSPALVEKARILMALGDWDLANEVLQRVLSQEADNVEACRLLTLHALTREASPKVHLQK
jgi:tetratricopeptide repeat protein 21B